MPDAHVHHLVDTRGIEPQGDPINGRRLLMWNNDVEIAICRPSEEQDYFYKNGEGDEVVFVHEGRGHLETTFGTLAYEKHDYVVIPRSTIYRFVPEGNGTLLLTFHTPGEIETPKRYRNRYGQLLEHAPFCHRDFKAPARLVTHRDRGDYDLIVRVRDGHQHYKLDYHPLDVVAWDGYVYPYTFNIADFEPVSGRIHQPPPAHQTFQGPNFVICSFCPRKLDWDENAIPIPYNHSNLQSEEMIYYVDGQFGSRKGVDVGTITLHPSGLPHGPQPGLAEKSIGTTETDELAVMCDTFKPLKLTQLAHALDDGKYALSWYDGDAAPGAAEYERNRKPRGGHEPPLRRWRRSPRPRPVQAPGRRRSQRCGRDAAGDYRLFFSSPNSPRATFFCSRLPSREPRKSPSVSIPPAGAFAASLCFFSGFGASAGLAGVSIRAASFSRALSASARVPYFANSGDAFALPASIAAAGFMLDAGASIRECTTGVGTPDSLEHGDRRLADPHRGQQLLEVVEVGLREGGDRWPSAPWRPPA